jgi:8-oxo-dGTP pyrophosphatase MutT (NUDIX family)
MRFGHVVRCLAAMPSPLPPGDRTIDPVLIGGVADLPSWTRSEPAAARRAAALLLVFPDAAGEARIVLTERPDGLRHARQVSLPGGKEDPGDDFPVGTALREAAEEVGLDAQEAGVTVLGRLDVVDVRVSGFMLTPVIAVADRAPVLVASPGEVASILLPPVDVFLPGGRVTIVDQERDGYRIRYGGYPYEGRHIWGATARALAQLGAILADGPP